MSDPDRDTVYSRDGTGTNRTIYTRESNSTGWFVGIIVALALLAIAYLVFSANSQPASTSVDVNNTPAVTTPATPATPAPADTNTTPMAPADNGTAVTPATPAPTAPADTTPSAATSTTPSAPAADVSSAPATASSALAASSVSP